MKQRIFSLSCLAAAVMVLGTSAAQAATIIPAEQLMSGILQELRKDNRYAGNNLYTDVRVKKFRIVSVKVQGSTPKPKPYWLRQGAVPYVNCTPQDSNVSMSVTGTDRSEVSLSETQSSTGSVSVELGGEFAGVGASVAASFSQTVETGRTTTNSHEFTQTKSQDGLLKPRSGIWAAPTSGRFYYRDAPYEVEIEVTGTESFVALNKMWIPTPISGALPRFTVKGKVTAAIPVGEIGLGMDPMPDSEIAEWCESNSLWDQTDSNASIKSVAKGKAANAKSGQVKAFVGMVSPDKRRALPKPAFQDGTPVPDNVKILGR